MTSHRARGKVVRRWSDDLLVAASIFNRKQHRHANSHVPFDVTMEEPRSCIVGGEAEGYVGVCRHEKQVADRNKDWCDLVWQASRAYKSFRTLALASIYFQLLLGLAGIAYFLFLAFASCRMKPGALIEVAICVAGLLCSCVSVQGVHRKNATNNRSQRGVLMRRTISPAYLTSSIGCSLLLCSKWCYGDLIYLVVRTLAYLPRVYLRLTLPTVQQIFHFTTPISPL